MDGSTPFCTRKGRSSISALSEVPRAYAHRISDGGLIVGRASTTDGEFRPFVSFGTGAPFDLSHLDKRLGGVFSTAVDVNSAGYLVGYRQTHKDHMAARRRVFVYRDFQVIDYGTFGGEDGSVAALNRAGHLVGTFSTEPHADYADHRAFLFDGKRLTDLGSLGGRMTTPTDINDSDQVVGYAQVPSGENHAFLYHAGVEGPRDAAGRDAELRVRDQQLRARRSGPPIRQAARSARCSLTEARSGISTR